MEIREIIGDIARAILINARLGIGGTLLSFYWEQKLQFWAKVSTRFSNGDLGAETWILIKSDEHKLEAFQMSCLRQILGLYAGLTLIVDVRSDGRTDIFTGFIRSSLRR